MELTSTGNIVVSDGGNIGLHQTQIYRNRFKWERNSFSKSHCHRKSTVSGTTTTVNSTTVSVADQFFEIGDDSSDDNLDRGIKMKYNSSGAKIHLGFDDSDGKFIMIPDAQILRVF